MWRAILWIGLLPGAESSAEAVRISVLAVDEGGGTVWFTADRTLAGSEILSASMDGASIELVLLGGSGDVYESAVLPPGAAASLHGQTLEAAVIAAPAAPTPPAPSEAEVVRELEAFLKGIGPGVTAGTLRDPLIGPRRTTPQWHGEVGVRAGYERFSRSLRRSDELDPGDLDGIRRALARAMGLIDRARDVPGINQADLDQARTFLQEAAAILDDPAGDPDEAVNAIAIAEIIVQLAVERAGAAGIDLGPIDLDRSTEDDYTGSVFGWLNRDFLPAPDLRSHVQLGGEAGDRFVSGSANGRLHWRATHFWDLRVASESLIRDYVDDYADDVYDQRGQVESSLAVSEWLEWVQGLRGTYRREYHTRSDDGYADLVRYTELRFSPGISGRWRIRYEHQLHRNNELEDRIFDYDRDRIRLAYDYFGAAFSTSVDLEFETRDFARPGRQDDYDAFTASARLRRLLFRPLAAGVEVEYDRRRYSTTGSIQREGDFIGEDNTDFRFAGIEPFVEVNWSRSFRVIPFALLGRLRHVDRVPADGIDKSQGDTDSLGGGIELEVTPASPWTTTIRYEYLRRNLPNGETGLLEPWFAQFDYLADSGSHVVSLWATFSLRSHVELRLSGFYSREDYPRFPELDNSQLAAETVLAWRF